MILLPIFHQKRKRYAEITQITTDPAFIPIFGMRGQKSKISSSEGNVCLKISIIMFILCLLGLSTANSSNIGAHFLIDLYQHIMISVPVQGIWDGVTPSNGAVKIKIRFIKIWQLYTQMI